MNRKLIFAMAAAASFAVLIPFWPTPGVAADPQQGPPISVAGAPGQGGSGFTQSGPARAQGGMMAPMPMIGGGNFGMVEDGNHLFIVEGGMIYKVEKSSLKTVATGELARPHRMPMRQRDGGMAPPPGSGGKK